MIHRVFFEENGAKSVNPSTIALDAGLRMCRSHSRSQIPPGTKFVKIPELQRWLVVPATPDLYKKIANAPDDVMSMNEAVEDVSLTFGLKSIFTP